jgi:hypothetical protein
MTWIVRFHAFDAFGRFSTLVSTFSCLPKSQKVKCDFTDALAPIAAAQLA